MDMSTSPIRLVVGDVRPVIYIQLRQPDQPLDVSTAQVLLNFMAEGVDVILFQMVGELLAGDLQADLITADMSQYPTPGSGGRVRFRFAPGALNLTPGRYVGEVVVAYGPSNTFTPYTRLQFLLRGSD
jgi:hypothetical protein